jgi:D-3-phosphoglycerate dehydrogenase
MQNVTLTSHAAFRTLEASMTLMRRAIEIVRRIVTPSPGLEPVP